MSGPFLHVAEKPSVARAIADALSGGRRGASTSSTPGGTPVFEFNAAIPPYPDAPHIVTSVAGHLMGLDFAPPFKCVPIAIAPALARERRATLRLGLPTLLLCCSEWTSCNPIDLFSAPVHTFVPHDKAGIERQLQDKARRARVRCRQHGAATGRLHGCMRRM